eukprot:GEZU01004436.1.p2 GENE.GEZU01004436.1~~GEZU01004436.1.p2  ORF type:complete len:134 (+),score=20.40 GEZU01004436.1:684-1085(+)
MCDMRGELFIVIQSNEGGYLFGGYTSVNWRSRGDIYIFDPEIFMFSLINPKGTAPLKLTCKRRHRACISDNPFRGPIFGQGYDLCLYDDFNVKPCPTRLGISFNSAGDYNEMKYFLTGSSQFTVREIEAFCVE